VSGNEVDSELQADVAAISRLDGVPTILSVICKVTGMGFAAVARVTDTRWIACAVRDDIQFGLHPGGELDLDSTICSEIYTNGEPVVIDEVASDPDFCTHHTPARYGFQSYISMPIYRRSGEFFGTLCAIDPRPAQLKNDEVISMFRLFADLIGSELDAQQRLATSEAALLDERERAELREQFIAVLGHDLRNPLASIAAGAQVLAHAPLDTRASTMVGMISKSVQRMARLIDDVMDFARGRLGGGLGLVRQDNVPLQPTIEQVVSELRVAWPDRLITSSLSMTESVACDPGRIGQLLSNLLANALTHGDTSRPVHVAASTTGGVLELSVINHGTPMSPQTLAQLFQPFVRATDSRTEGLGLGLYIVSEIARAHSGSLDVVSNVDETRFTFRMSCATGAV